MNDEKKTVVIDASELDNFELCAMRHHLVHHRNLRETAKAMDEGSLLHDLLEDYYNRIKDGVVIEQDVIEDIVEKGKIKSLEYETLQLEEVSIITFQFREYCSHYENETIVPVYVEQPFLKLIYEDETLRIYVSGKPDLVFHYEQSPNELCVMDHKKVVREHPYTPLRNQFLLYSTAIETDTFIVNKVGFQKTKKRHERFTRAPFVYSEETKEEWKTDLVHRVREMLLYQESGYYPRNRTSCEKFRGCYFQRYCATKPSAREFLIGTEYHASEAWDVTKGLKEEDTNDNP